MRRMIGRVGPGDVGIEFISGKGRQGRNNAKELIDALRAVEEAPTRRGKLERAALAGGRVISYEAERLAPTDTGRAAKTIRARLYSSAPGVAIITVGPSSRGYYLYYQEKGTRHHPAQPFLRPAFDAKQVEAIKAMRDEYKRIIEQAAARRAAR